MSDVSAVVLSIGESYMSRALRSLEAQTYPLREVIVVENVSPFFRALNVGASRVTTPFFLQVDADMIPDPTCVQELRAAMRDGVGVVCGDLRDPLMGQLEGIKLFRTETVRSVAYPDTISQDTDFNAAMVRAGWRLQYVGHPPADSLEPNATYGEHRPDYTPEYTFQKYLIEGRKYRYRGARPGLFSKMEGLERSTHELAFFGRMALAHGFFLNMERDELKPTTSDPRARWLDELLRGSDRASHIVERLLPVSRHDRLRDVFRAFAKAGRELAATGAGQGIHDAVQQLGSVRRKWPVMVATLGLGHGILAQPNDDASLDADEAALATFIHLGVGRRLGPTDAVRASLERLYYRLPDRFAPGRGVVPWYRRVPPW